MDLIIYLILIYLIFPVGIIITVFFILKKIFGIKVVKIIFIISTVFLLIIGMYTYEKMRIISSHKSPNNKYELVIKQTEFISNFIPAMPGQGGVGDKSVIAILKHKGKEIHSSEENFLYQSLEVEWNLKQNQVHYTRIDYFNLLED